MNSVNATIAPEPDALEEFWQVSRKHVGYAAFEALLGSVAHSTIQPPAFQYSKDAGEADAWVEQLKTVGKAVLVTPLNDFPDEDLPRRGDLAIVCDGRGAPAALALTVEVTREADTVREQLTLVYPQLAEQK